MKTLLFVIVVCLIAIVLSVIGLLNLAPANIETKKATPIEQKESPKPVEAPKPVEEPKPVEAPKLDSFEEPTFEPIVEEPTFEPVEESKPVEAPKLDSEVKPIEEPKQVVVEEPKQVVVEEPKQVVVEEPKQVVVEAPKDEVIPPNITYEKAYEIALSSKRPLVVVVGAKWCAPCKQLKETVLPKLQLGRKILVKIDHDDDRELVNKITSGAVPQIIRYRYEGDKGWMVTKMTGLHSVEEVQKFVDEE